MEHLKLGFKRGSNQYLPIFLFQTMFMNIPPTESGKGGTLLYIDKNIKYKLRNDLNIYEKEMAESTFIENLNKKQKNMIIGCVYKHPKHEFNDFTNNYITPLLDKLSNENKDIMFMGDFNINLIMIIMMIKILVTFLTQCSLNLFYLTLQHPLELQETLKHLSITSIITSLSIILFLET